MPESLDCENSDTGLISGLGGWCVLCVVCLGYPKDPCSFYLGLSAYSASGQLFCYQLYVSCMGSAFCQPPSPIRERHSTKQFQTPVKVHVLQFFFQASKKFPFHYFGRTRQRLRKRVLTDY